MHSRGVVVIGVTVAFAVVLPAATAVVLPAAAADVLAVGAAADQTIILPFRVKPTWFFFLLLL